MSNKICAICGREMTDWEKEDKALPYRVCEWCDLVQMKEERWLNERRERERYETHNNTAENAGYVKMFEEFLAEIEPYTESVVRVLDFGCGPGPVLAELMRKRGWEVDVYDPYFAPSTKWEGEKYDLVVSTEVFEHMKKPMAEMQKLAGVLNKGGVLAVMTRFHPREREIFKTWWYKRDPTHVSFFTPLTMVKMAEESGMRLKMTDGEKVVVMEKIGE